MQCCLAAMIIGFALLLVVGHRVQFWIRRRWWTAGAAPAWLFRSPSMLWIGNAAERPPVWNSDVTLSHPHGTGRRKKADLTVATRGCEGSRTRKVDLKVACGGRALTIAGAQRVPFVDLHWKLSFTKNKRTTTIIMALDQMDFGIKNCCTQNCSSLQRPCDSNCNLAFIHKVTIRVCPKSWAAQDCHRLLLEPSIASEAFALQRSSTFGLQIPIVNPNQTAVSYQRVNTISRSALAFGWVPASRDDVTNSITFTWELDRWANGSKFKLNTLTYNRRPEIGVSPHYIQLPPGSFLVNASWELLRTDLLQLENVEWDIKISLYTAVSQKRYFLGHSVTESQTFDFERRLAF